MAEIQSPEIKSLFGRAIHLKQLLDAIPTGILLLDPECRVVALNNALEALTGFTHTEASGLPCFYVLKSKSCFQGCPAKKTQSSFEPVCTESDIINRERQLIPVRLTLASVIDVGGQLAGFVESVEDLRPLQEVGAKKSQPYSFGNIIGKSPQMERIFQTLPVLAQSDSAILITGETGTGKDMLAEAIHEASNRAKGPFIKINCGALPETLLESELFGHKKGAFTGAVENKPGRFRLAHNGTLYLTEIGDLPLAPQIKLLTFLDDKVVYPLGSTKGFQADVRIIAATHRNLEQMVQEAAFREDLLFRLNVVRLHLPPLREREDDIRLLIDHFLNFFSAQLRKNIQGVSKKGLKFLLDYPFPGNVRELRNILEYAVNICPGGKILPEHMPAYLTESASFLEAPAQGADSMPGKVPLETSALFKRYPAQNWASLEREMILNALIKSKGRRNKAAAILGWGRSTLWRKMKQYGIAP